MNKQRSGGMTAVAVLNFIFGGVGILAALFGLIFANSLMSNPMMMPGAKGGRLGILMLLTALLSLPPAGAAIVSGIGILKLAAWGRTWTLVYAILAIVATFINSGLASAIHDLNPDVKQFSPVLSVILGCVYPAILLWLINTKKWNEAFNSSPGKFRNFAHLARQVRIIIGDAVHRISTRFDAFSQVRQVCIIVGLAVFLLVIVFKIGNKYSKLSSPSTSTTATTSKHNWIAIGGDKEADLFIDSRIIEYCVKLGATDTISVLTKRRLTPTVKLSSSERDLLKLDEDKAIRAAYVIDTEMYNIAVPQVRYVAFHCYDSDNNILGYFNFEDADSSKWRPITTNSKLATIYDSARRIFLKALKDNQPK